MKSIIFGAAVAASLTSLSLAAGPAMAQGREPAGFTVSSQGYDLTRPGDVARLRQSVKKQIMKYCEVEQTGSRLISAEELRCREELLSSASQAIDQQIRVATERGKSGGRG